MNKLFALIARAFIGPLPTQLNSASTGPIGPIPIPRKPRPTPRKVMLLARNLTSRDGLVKDAYGKEYIVKNGTMRRYHND